MRIGIARTPLCNASDFVFCGDVLGRPRQRHECAPPSISDISGSTSAAFVHKRLRMLAQIRALREAHEQGLALDMAIAADGLATAADELAASVRNLLARKARMETHVQHSRAYRMRRAHVDAQVQNALYEARALREWIAGLFETFLRPEPPDPSSVWPDGRSLPESYPWLRLRLESCNVLIKHTLTLDVED